MWKPPVLILLLTTILLVGLDAKQEKEQNNGEKRKQKREKNIENKKETSRFSGIEDCDQKWKANLEIFDLYVNEIWADR